MMSADLVNLCVGLIAAVDYPEELTGRGPNRQVGAEKAGARTESLDAVHAALRAADEIAAALQAHLTQEHGAHVEDRSHAVAPTPDLLRHARERIAAGA